MDDPTFYPDEEPHDPQEIAEKVASGEYFREMRGTFATVYLDPMPERYFFLVYTALCVLTLLFSAYAFARLFPLNEAIPFLYYSDDVFEERPAIRPLLQKGEEDINTAIVRFLAGEYVTRRETYDIRSLELNVRFVKAHSDPAVFDLWQKQLDPGNPDSPISQFQRHTTRTVQIVQLAFNQNGTADIVYDAAIRSAAEQKTLRMIATLAFQYTNVSIDQGTGAKTPVHFVVTDYHTRRLQE